MRTLCHAAFPLILVAAAIVSAARATAAEASPLLRFPDVHGDAVVFVHAEDVWLAPTTGGLARRLTDDEGEERHPKFSPDGSLIAFTAEIDGNPDVFVMDAGGGNIRRLTYHPAADEVVGWHPIDSRVLFRSRRASYSRFDRLFLVAPDGTGLEQLPLHEAGRGSYSHDGTKIAYNRVAREDRTWKRYRGGMAQDLWLFDLATQKDRRLTDYRGTDRLPMWVGDALYFASDRDRVLNIYAYDLADGNIARITNHTDYDVRRPSHGGTSIVYEMGGSLWLLDTTTGRTRAIPIEIPTDPRETRPYVKNVSDFVTEVTCSPGGGRALVVARGEVFTVPKEHGPTRNLSRSAPSREKNAVWSPDGSRIAYFSDRSGEFEIYVVDPLGDDESRQLTRLGPGYRHTPRWSPDGKRIAFTDQTLTLYYLDVDSGEVVTVDRAEVEPMDIALEAKPISDFDWSPDSRWLAYSKIGRDRVSNLHVYSLETGASRSVSNGLFNDFGPVFTRGGRHLLFVSNRRFDPTFCDFEWEMVYKNVAGIYALTLAADGEPLLPLLSDEVEPIDADEEPAGKEKDDAAVTVSIDFDRIAERVEALPLPAGNYRQLAAGDDAVYYLDGEQGDFNRFEYRSPGPRDLKSFSFEDREATTVVPEIDAYSLSADGSHVAYLKAGKVGLQMVREAEPFARFQKKLGKDGPEEDGELDLSGLTMELDPKAEWRQVFDEAWRLEREFFYEPNMHGVDWPAMREKYGRMLDRATCAQDVRFVIGELIGELATSHTYVRPGERRRDAKQINAGMLGADWEIDREAGRYRVKKILRVPDWSRGIKPPLAGPGIAVQEGDYLLAVDGREVKADREIYAYFQNLAGRHVRVTFNDRPTEKGAREYTVKPLASERFLRYLDWVEHNRHVVDEASEGRIGYIHLPDTYVGSAIEFPKQFYAQSRKQGLVVDGRFNGGGLDPDIFLQRLARRPLSYWTRRYSDDQLTPVYANRAHMVFLTNRQAGSGGDEIVYEFRRKGMGPIVGTRTWGGLVGVSMFIGLMDGSMLTAPDYRMYTPEGAWEVENEGVSPDIEIELDPTEMQRGHDAQLAKAIELLLQQLEENPLPEISHPPFPSGI
jgi:tricorn protease